MKRRRSGSTFGIGLAVTLAVVGCSASPTDSDGPAAPADSTLTVALGNELVSWAPQDQGGGAGLVWLQPVYDTLLLAEPDGTIAPMLASGWEYSDDLSTLTLDLRDDVTFTSGANLTADAVRINLEATRDAGGPLASALASIEEVVVVDDHTVELDLSDPDPFLLRALTRPSGAIASPELVESGEVKTAVPDGTGPYTFDEAASTAGSEYVFVAKDDYWDPSRIKFGTVVYKPMTDATARMNALQSGQIQGTYGDVFSIEQARTSGLNVTLSDGSDLLGLYFLDKEGELVPELEDPRVRHAIGLAFDRQAMLDALYDGYGQPMVQVFGPQSPGWLPDLTVPVADVATARSLMSEAGYPDGFTISMPEAPWFEAVNPIIEQQLGEIGIAIDWTPVSSADVVTASQSGDFGMIVMNLDDSDPWRFIGNVVQPTGAWNIFEQIDPELEQLIATARTSDPDSLDAAYQEINRWLVEDDWMVPLLLVDSVYFSSPEIVVEAQQQQPIPALYNFAPAN